MKKILIVDDQADIRRLVELVVGSADRIILTAANGADAISIARKEVPDLIFMDIMMPGEVDGYQATRVLKADVKTARCPIIAMTAKISREEREQALTSGVDAFLGKPFQLTELREKIARFLG
ncbi:MAG TPA: response regulator [Gammaproteobacteria bacterium]|nr:response regulator [Gammaproteobacteria bacterium]